MVAELKNALSVAEVGAALGLFALSLVCGCNSPANESPLIGVWEDAERSAKGGQLPGGEIWQFRPDRTYARMGALMLENVEGGPSPVGTKTTIDQCMMTAIRTEPSGVRSARIATLSDRGGRFSVDGDNVVLERTSSKPQRLSFLQTRARLVLTEIGGTDRHDLRRVEWFTLPSAAELKNCTRQARETRSGASNQL